MVDSETSKTKFVDENASSLVEDYIRRGMNSGYNLLETIVDCSCSICG